MKSKLLLPALIVIILAGVVYGSINIYKSKNSWVCANGQWKRKGSPRTSQPTTSCPGVSDAQKIPAVPPESIVRSFYSQIKKEDTTVLQNYTTNSALATNFKRTVAKELQQQPTINPFTCSDETLNDFTIKQIIPIKTKATVIVEETLQLDKKTIPVAVQTAGTTWQITNIQCPQ